MGATTKIEKAPSASQPEPVERKRRELLFALRVLEAGPVLVLAILVITFSFWSEAFFTERNIQNLLVQSSMVTALAIGQLFVMLTRGIDISVGSVLALASVVGGLVWQEGGNGLVVILTILGVGAAVGLFNGVVLVKGKVLNPFIVTLAVYGIARGLALVISDGEPSGGISPAVITLGSGYLGVVPVPALVVAGIGLIAFLVTRSTQWGRWIYAVGGEPEAARRSGIPVNKVLISVYVICGLSAGIAAILTTGRTASAFPTAGNLAELEAITAVIVGGASFSGGRGNVGQALVGGLIVGVIHNGLGLIGVEPFWQQCAIGLMILLAVELNVVRGQLESRFRTLQSREAES